MNSRLTVDRVVEHRAHGPNFLANSVRRSANRLPRQLPREDDAALRRRPFVRADSESSRRLHSSATAPWPWR